MFTIQQHAIMATAHLCYGMSCKLNLSMYDMFCFYGFDQTGLHKNNLIPTQLFWPGSDSILFQWIGSDHQNTDKQGAIMLLPQLYYSIKVFHQQNVILQ